LTTDQDGLLPAEEPTEDDLILKPFVSVGIRPEDGETPSGGDSVSQFDLRHRDNFTGMLYLGKLKDEFHYLGHVFSLETPTHAEKLEAGLIHKPHINAISSDIAWAALTTALYLRAVDGTDLPSGIGPRDTGLKDRYNWIIENIRSSIINKLFEQCLILDAKVEAALAELDRLGES